MRQRVFRLIEAVRASYWFIPGAMSVLAVALGFGMLWLDSTLGTEWLSDITRYRRIEADGAREVLSTIAGSMITVAGVAFSITIVAISFASAQYGPRVLTNFMSDRGNTVTLGTFIATFLYCLVVLLTVRAGDERAFVPQLAVLVGLALAVCSIIVLIYFIHHVPRSIHVNTVVARIGQQLLADVAVQFPASIGTPVEGGENGERSGQQLTDATAGGDCQGLLAPVRSRATGYIQYLDEDTLLATARRHNLVARLRYRPGDFVSAGRVLMDVFPAERLDSAAEEGLRASYTMGDMRTPSKDLGFLVGELVEIASRALSPGVNDPLTAISCMDWLGAFMSELAGRRIPSSKRADHTGTIRVIAPAQDFATFVEQGFGRIRQYAADDMVAALHLLRTLGEVAATCREPEQLRALEAEAERLARMADDALTGAAREKVFRRAIQLRDLVAAGVGNIDDRQWEWLGGSAG
jgi:uncharacterized membrane protein